MDLTCKILIILSFAALSGLVLLATFSGQKGFSKTSITQRICLVDNRNGCTIQFAGEHQIPDCIWNCSALETNTTQFIECFQNDDNECPQPYKDDFQMWKIVFALCIFFLCFILGAWIMILILLEDDKKKKKKVNDTLSPPAGV